MIHHPDSIYGFDRPTAETIRTRSLSVFQFLGDRLVFVDYCDLKHVYSWCRGHLRGPHGNLHVPLA